MKPNFAILEQRDRDGRLALVIDTATASYQGIAWRALGDYGKRKFENLLVLMHQPSLVTPLYV